MVSEVQVQKWQTSTYHLPKALTLHKTTGQSGLDTSRDTAKDLKAKSEEHQVNALIYIYNG